MVKKEDEDTGVVWDARIRVEEFIKIMLKKFVAFLEMWRMSTFQVHDRINDNKGG